MAILIEYEGKRPQVDPTAFVAPNACLIGDVVVGPRSSIWFGAVLRADHEAGIRIGARTSVQDNVVMHVYPGMDTVIGDDVTVGHGAILEGCRVERYALIGMNAVILSGAQVGEYSIVAAGAVVTENAVVEPRTVVAGAPAKKKELEGNALKWIEMSAPTYVELAETYRRQGIGLP